MDATLTDCVISSNRAGNSAYGQNPLGGGIVAYGGKLAIRSSVLQGNSVTCNDYLSYHYGYGGALILKRAASVSCEGCTFSSNTAKYSASNDVALQSAAASFSVSGCPEGYAGGIDGYSLVIFDTINQESVAGYSSYACEACSVGFYQDQSDQPSCIPCPIGTYQSKTGKSSCIDCPEGLVTFQNASTDLRNCSSSS